MIANALIIRGGTFPPGSMRIVQDRIAIFAAVDAARLELPARWNSPINEGLR